jgi:hypothetical protein
MVDVFTPPATPHVNPAPAAPVRVAAPDPSTRAPTVSNPALSAPQERWAADRAAAAANDPWQQDPAKVMMVKDPTTGEITARARDGSTTGDPANPGDPASATTDGKVLRLGDLELSEADVRKLMVESAQREAARANMPSTPAEYSLDLPADFKMPDGVQWKWAENDPVLTPLIGMAKEWAHAHGIDQAGFSKMMSLYAATQVHEGQLIAKARAAEVGKLGANAPVRIDAVTQFLRGNLGDAHAKALTAGLHTAAAIQALEVLVTKFTNQGGGSYSGAHREPPQKAGTVSTEQYARMSYTERKNYAAQFEQR